MDDFVPWKVVFVGDGRKTFLHAVHRQQDFFGPMGEQGTLDVLAIPNGRELILTVTEDAEAFGKAGMAQDAQLFTDSPAADVGGGEQLIRSQGTGVDEKQGVNPCCGFRESPGLENVWPFLHQIAGCR